MADAPHGRYIESTPSQTAWAVLGLMAAGAADHPATARGIAYLARRKAQMANGLSCLILRSVFLGCSTCATTATGCIFRCWPYLGIAI